MNTKRRETEKRRKAYESAITTLIFRKPLTPDESELIQEIALDLLSGHDARQLLGIKPARGPRVRNEGFELNVATYFWALRMCKPKMLAKAAAVVVSHAYNIRPPRVEKIARKRRAFVQDVITMNPHTNWLSNSEGMARWNVVYGTDASLSARAVRLAIRSKGPKIYPYSA